MNFHERIDHLGQIYKKRLRAIFRRSVQETVFLAQLPTAQGGRMRVDTGFLRASGGAEINQLPTGPTRNESGGNVTGQLTGVPLAVALASWDAGDTFYWGWTAEYARIREYKDGFMKGAAEKWPEIVAKVTRSVRAQSFTI